MTKRAVIITSSIIVGILMILTTLFGVVFRVREIKVACSDDFYYKNQVSDILTTSKLKKNTSVFDIDRDKIFSNIESAYPYARVEGVALSSLTSVKIKLSNREPIYYFVQEALYYILDEDCKVLEITNDSTIASQYILLNSVFNATEETACGQFLNNGYSQVCSNLYKALYSYAAVEVEDQGEYIDKYLNREDMCQIITSIAFDKVYELNGKVDKLKMTTSYGVSITIIEPQKELNTKINMAFSAIRSLQKQDRLNSTALLQTGSINIIYNYDDNKNATISCEYRA